MVQVAAAVLQREVDLEISIHNVDKPDVNRADLLDRLKHLPATQRVWITRAATFVEKSELFPGTTFVVGADTIRRIGEPAYYGDGVAGRNQALIELAERNCRFLVFGRLIDGSFCELADLQLDACLRQLCVGVAESDFRLDLSSTEIRGRLRFGGPDDRRSQ